MATAQERTDKHTAQLGVVDDRLDTCSTLLDDLVTKILSAGAQDNDPYRMRIETLRLGVEALRAKIVAHEKQEGEAVAWGTFFAEVQSDLRAIDLGCEELIQ